MTTQTRYAEQVGTWTTPGGNRASFTYRADTNDFNIIGSCLLDDEYSLPKGLKGLALDIGAHIGAVTVALALDNPGLRVTAIEPVPSNLDLLRRNVAINGVEYLVRIIEGAAGKGQVTVRHGFTGDESALHHAFVGNSILVNGEAGRVTVYDGWTLSELAAEPVAFCKVDIEGDEYTLLDDPAVSLCRVIAGEWHPSHGNAADILALLDRTHAVTFNGSATGPGGFRAVRR